MMTITSWPLAERPREKLLTLGAKNLSDAELLAIFLRTGIRGKTALDLARELLIEFGSLKKLLNAGLNSFLQKKGLGKAKFALLKAAVELGLRYDSQVLIAGDSLRDSAATKRFLENRLRHYEHEVFACLFLDNQNCLIVFEELFQGTINEANVYPRELVKRALSHNAAKVIFAHNHPSGNALPSKADRELTLLLKEALALVEIQVVDHVVVGLKECVSFAEMGLV